MSNLNSAQLREEIPHITETLKRRAQSVINDKSIDGCASKSHERTSHE